MKEKDEKLSHEIHPAPKKDDLGPINIGALRTIVQGALARNSSVVFEQHCCDHMRGRGFSSSDVLYVLETGDYKLYPPAWHSEYGNWIYFVVGKDLDDMRLKIIFSVEDCGSIMRIISAQRFSKGREV